MKKLLSMIIALILTLSLSLSVSAKYQPDMLKYNWAATLTRPNASEFEKRLVHLEMRFSRRVLHKNYSMNDGALNAKKKHYDHYFMLKMLKEEGPLSRELPYNKQERIVNRIIKLRKRMKLSRSAFALRCGYSSVHA